VLTAGLEIGSRELVVCLEGSWSRFNNDGEGHRKLLRYLTRRGEVRVCLEATGNYHLDVALALHGHGRVQVQVLNPWVARRFAEARLQRAKTDRVDAAALAEYAARMPHQEWQPPSASALALRSIARRMQQLAERKSSEGSRLHAASAAEALPEVVVQSIREELRHLDEQLAMLQAEARAVVHNDAQLEQLLEGLLTIPGVGERSGLYLLGELAPLGRDMSARQLVAHAGLDPRPIESGSSVHKPRRISKRGNSRLRHILYMTALVAARRDQHFNGFYVLLLQRHKAKRVALVAVMRKQLHAICGIWRSGVAFDGSRLFPRLTAA
jgi:transposase